MHRIHGGRTHMPSDANSDAFALNVGHEDWQRARVADAYAAALQLQTDFKLFLSFDMT
jgi:glucan endo-1,3-alpha-glucosidase